MTIGNIPSRNASKQRGEWVELQFMARATQQGLIVSKPWGDSSRYDFVVEHEGRFSRVQVKSTLQQDCQRKEFYRWPLASSQRERSKAKYTAQQVDFFALYAIPDDVWYIVPMADIRHSTQWFHAAPWKNRAKSHSYLEAWGRLRRVSEGE